MSNYTAELVRESLYLIWREPDTEPSPATDADLIRGTVDPKTGGTWMAVMADMRSAWGFTNLTLNEERALTLFFGADATQDYIAWQLDLSQQRVSQLITSGVEKITDSLNGKENPQK